MLRTTTRSQATLQFHLIALFISLLFINLGLRVFELGAPSLWSDEVLTHYRAEASIEESLRSIVKTIDQTPVYFMLMRLFPTHSEFLLRLPSALLGMIGTGVLMLVILWLYEDSRWALWVGLWVTFNPFHLWLSRTARVYALIFLLSVLLSYLFLQLLRGKRMWMAFTLTSLVAYLTHYSLMALPMVQLIILAKERSWPFARRWMMAQAMAVIPVFLWGVAVVLNFSPREPQWGAPPQLPDMGLTYWNLLIGYDGMFHWYLLPMILAVGVGVVRGVRRVETYWLVLATVPIFAVFILSITAIDVYIDRYFMVILPALMVILAAGWRDMSQDWQRVAMAGIAFSGAMIFFATLHRAWNEREDWRGVAAFVDYQTGDVVVVDRAVTLRAFEHYFLSPVEALQLSETDEPTKNQAARYWVIYRHPSEDIHRLGQMPPFDALYPNHSVISRWIQQQKMTLISFREFAGVTVLLYEP